MLGATWADGAASLLIGILLAIVAVFLVLECRGLLLGESVDEQRRLQMEQLTRADPDVTAGSVALAIHLGPHDVLVVLDVEFDDDLRADGIERAVLRREATIRAAVLEVTKVFVVPRRWPASSAPQQV